MSEPPAPPLHEVDCPVCGTSARRVEYAGLELAGRPTSLYRCARCDTRYVSPRRTGDDLMHQYTDPEKQDRYYREEYAPIVPSVVRHTARTMTLLEAFCPRGTLLDYGCGAGVMAAAASRRGWRALGFDVSPMAAGWGRELLGVDIVSRWENVTASSLAPFDAVAMIEVLEHVERPLETIHHGLSVLRPGGVLVVSTPNFASLARLRRGADWPVIYPEAHILYLTPRVLRGMLAECGLRPLRMLTWWNELGRLPAPRLWASWLSDPPGGHALLAFARRP